MLARRHARYAVVALASGATLLLGLVASGPALAGAATLAVDPGSCVTTPSAVVPGVQIADPACTAP